MISRSTDVRSALRSSQRGFLLNPSRFSGGVSSDPYFSSVTALLHLDGADASTTFTDVKGPAWTAYNGAKISTTQSKFGGASGFFDGSNDYASTSISNLIGTADLTVEAWIYMNSVASDGEILCIYNGADGLFSDYNLVFEVGAGGVLRGSLQTGSGSTNVDISSSASEVTTGTWTHIAFVADGSTARLFVGGIQKATGAITGTRDNSKTVVAIGRLNNSVVTRYFNGYIDEVRITKGVARYTAAFTPPTAAFPNS